MDEARAFHSVRSPSVSAMADTPSLSPRAKRSRVDIWTLVLCATAVTTASFFSRRTGACGTAHYVFFQLLGGAIVSTVEELWQSRYDELIARGLAVVFNVGAFLLLSRVWYRRAPHRWFVVGLVAITALYVTSYFFFFPTRDCP